MYVILTIFRYKGFFNWTMSYRRDSDIFSPYGWTKIKGKYIFFNFCYYCSLKGQCQGILDTALRNLSFLQRYSQKLTKSGCPCSWLIFTDRGLSTLKFWSSLFKEWLLKEFLSPTSKFVWTFCQNIYGSSFQNVYSAHFLLLSYQFKQLQPWSCQ